MVQGRSWQQYAMTADCPNKDHDFYGCFRLNKYVNTDSRQSSSQGIFPLMHLTDTIHHKIKSIKQNEKLF